MHSRPCKGLTIGCSELVAVGVYYVLDSDWGGIFLYVVVFVFLHFSLSVCSVILISVILIWVY